MHVGRSPGECVGLQNKSQSVKKSEIMRSTFRDHSGIKPESSNRRERKMHKHVDINTHTTEGPTKESQATSQDTFETGNNIQNARDARKCRREIYSHKYLHLTKRSPTPKGTRARSQGQSWQKRGNDGGSRGEVGTGKASHRARAVGEAATNKQTMKKDK